MGNTKIRNSVKKLFAISFSMILSASALPVLNCSASVTENGAEYGVSVSGEKTYLTLYNVDDTITDVAANIIWKNAFLKCKFKAVFHGISRAKPGFDYTFWKLCETFEGQNG